MFFLFFFVMQDVLQQSDIYRGKKPQFKFLAIKNCKTSLPASLKKHKHTDLSKILPQYITDLGVCCVFWGTFGVCVPFFYFKREAGGELILRGMSVSWFTRSFRQFLPLTSCHYSLLQWTQRGTSESSENTKRSILLKVLVSQ